MATDQEIRDLTLTAQELVARIDTLVGDTGNHLVDLAKQSTQTRRMVWVLALSILLDVVLTVLMGVGMVSIRHNSDNIAAITHRLDTAQTVTRQKSLCPLYQLFLDSKSPQGRAAAPDKMAYDHAFVVIQEGYDALNCKEFIKVSP